MNGPVGEGVIRFHLEYREGPLPEWADPGDIITWFRRCRALGGIGRYPPSRHQGAAYGNISQRGAEGFLITGTQTGAREALTADDIAWVRDFDVARNRVVAEGPARPSSESLSHGQVYALRPTTGFVIHVHDALLWQHAAALDLPLTDPAAEYGTPAMALEVERVMALPKTLCSGAFAMGGHEDGIIVFGDDAEQAGIRLLRLYRRVCHRGAEPAD